MEKKKERIINILLVFLIVSLVGGFVLFFIGFYKLSLIVMGVFLFCAMFISKWTYTKNADYVYREQLKNNQK
ncbi:hypothetical protein DRW41_14055 [Neobacillus piezotolerans]|uniref:Uncharacterized protein n=1 Tax=Neobacillus piezotolerans TaxID=2259171 RepID=A0A3D8GPD6_9BACI|nr:hypothetical protein [Neobacillus piezotolerans]RDU36152.1 hypothetical protein DRW41_14055 [Neobacillus piezotolerans]